MRKKYKFFPESTNLCMVRISQREADGVCSYELCRFSSALRRQSELRDTVTDELWLVRDDAQCALLGGLDARWSVSCLFFTRITT